MPPKADIEMGAALRLLVTHCGHSVDYEDQQVCTEIQWFRATSPRSGPARPPEGARRPFGPRVGWLVIVVLLGAVGWLLFMNAKFRRRAAADREGG